jgi:hypothetical protein
MMKNYRLYYSGYSDTWGVTKFAGVVLQVEQVPHVLGHLCRTGTEVRTGEVPHDLQALSPLGLLLMVDQEERDRCVGGGGEAAFA